MSRLKDKIGLKGISISSISKHTGIHKAQVSQFINGHPKECNKQYRKILRAYLITAGILPAPKPRPKHPCPNCASVHVIKNKSTQPQENQ